MKKTALLVLLAFSALTVSAQDSTRTLFKNKGLNGFGMFVRGGVQYSQIANKNALIFDGVMGISFDRKLRLGFGFEALMNNVAVKNSALIAPYTRMRWQYSSFGAAIEYSFLSKRIVSITPGAMLGFGTISKHPMDGPNLDSDGSIDDSQFFVFKPYLNINLNFTKFIGFYVQGGYRLTTGEVTQGINDKQLSGPFGVAGLKFELGADSGF